MKLLIRATNWLGDAVMSIPAIREIRRVFSGWEVVILAQPWVAELYTRENFCGRILIYEHKGRHAGWAGKRRLAVELRREGFDCAILLQNAFDAALIAWAARIPRRIGYARDARRLLLTQTAAPPRKGETPAHQRFYYLELLRRSGLIGELPECADIRLNGAGEAAQSGLEWRQERGFGTAPWIGVSPGAAYGGAKRWLPERFAEAAAELAAELDAEVALFGSPAERELCESIRKMTGSKAHNLAGKTSLSEFINLAASCTLYLTNDSGPMHVAAALGVPTVAVFGATDHEATGPSAGWARVVREPVDCSPCLLRECPIDHRCMTRVEASRVAAEARNLLQMYRNTQGPRTPARSRL